MHHERRETNIDACIEIEPLARLPVDRARVAPDSRRSHLRRLLVRDLHPMAWLPDQSHARLPDEEVELLLLWQELP